MLKGHTDIYLRDAKTGEIVEECHEDNLVTNAVQDLLSMNPFGYRSGVSGQFPLATQALGGVLLFPDTIPESTTDYFAHGQWPTGYASNGADPNGDPRRGNFNPNESYATSNGYRLVWDFGTADANGDISCVCLTNTDGGIGYELSEYAYTKRVDYGSAIYFYDGDTTKQIQAYNNNCFYCAEWTSATEGQTPTLKILKWQTPPNRQPLSRKDRVDITSTTTIDISSTHIKSGTSRFPRRAFWDEYGYRIIVTDDRNNRDGNYYVVTVNWDGEVSEVAIPYGDMEDRVETYSTQGELVAYVRKDWAYIPWRKAVSGTITMGFYAVQLSNTSNMLVLTSEITNIWTGSITSAASFYTDAHEPFWRIPMKDIGYTRYYWEVVLDDGKILYEGECSYSTSGTQPTVQTTIPMALDSVYAMISNYYSGGTYFLESYLKPTYLATINNLSNTITKTADRTLKIVYTLTES